MGGPDDAPHGTADTLPGVVHNDTEPSEARHAGGLVGDAVGGDDLDARLVQETVRARLFDRGKAPQIGRYRVLRLLGEGGMGRVYAAYDERLDRRIAIKVLHHDVTETSRARVEREAKAMAKLTHPNVVQVYEAGEDEGEIHIAMEFVDGETVDSWLQEDRPWREVLAVFLQAGEGLAAAHSAGMIHRDFKPQNVMLESLDSARQRVLVLDFGLARLLDDLPSAEGLPPESTITAERTTTDPRLTATGNLLGTPAYMAPEQFENTDVGPASDQFSFCVALWEGLYGARPFNSSSLAELSTALVDGRPPEPPDSTSVPTWVSRAVVRGLSPNPDDRWPSLRALLDTLTQDPAKQRGRWLAVGAATTAVVAAGVGAQAWLSTRAERCSGATGRLRGVWDDAVRDRIQAGFDRFDAAFANPVRERTVTALDDYARAWAAMHTETCAATTLRQEQSIAVMDLRMACLQRASRQLRAATEVLSDADVHVVARAHHVVDRLPELERCADVTGLQAGHPPPRTDDAASVEAARKLLASARASHRAGRYSAARDEVEAAEAAVEGIVYDPLRIEIALLRGDVMDRLGRDDEAEAAFVTALELATDARHTDDMQAAASQLLVVVGAGARRPEEALSKYRLLAERLARDGTQAQAQFLDDLGSVHRTQNNFAEAESNHRQSLALEESLMGVGHPFTATPRSNLADALGRQGKFAESEAEFRKAIAVSKEALGPEHPAVARSMVNLGPVLRAQGRTEEAEALYRQGLAILLASVGPENTEVASVHSNLATLLSMQGKHTEAEAAQRSVLALRQRLLPAGHHDIALSHSNLGLVLHDLGQDVQAATEARLAIALWEKALGVDHPRLPTALNNLANALSGLEQYEEAIVAVRRAITILEARLGPTHWRVAGTRGTLAMLLIAQGQHDQAEVQLRLSLSLWEAAHGPDHAMVGMARSNLARFLVERERWADALPIAEQAWVRRQRDDILPGQRGETAFVLARALWMAQPEARPRALKLAQRALAHHSGVGRDNKDAAQDAQDVRAWLAEHTDPE